LVKVPKYYGILKNYPRVRRYFGKAADYVTLCRPFTLLGAWVAGFFLSVLFSKPNIDWLRSSLVGTVLALLQAGGQALNQSVAEEVEIDRINGKTYRPTVNGRLSLREGQAATALLFSAGVVVAFSLGVSYGLYSLLIAFFAVSYTAPPLRVKKVFVLNNVWQGLSRGLLPAIFVASAYPRYGLLPVLYGLSLAVWVTGAQTTKDFGDVDGDRAFGVKSFPVVLGRSRTIRLMALLMLAGFALFNAFLALGWLPLPFLALNALVAPSLLLLWCLRRNIRFEWAENSAAWVTFYITLGLFYTIPALVV
jgi:4-hydroxybenzoate polyprenyltransferase